MPRLSKIGAAALAAFGWTSGSSVTATYLVVAGGGGGGSNGAGGGAGGYRTGTLSLNPSLSYTVIVGAGGTKGVYATPAPTNGSDSTFSTITSTGGGYGGGSSTGAATGANGGSGGGGTFSNAAGNGNTPSTSPSQGNNGGSGNPSSPYGMGGGGGASAVGANGSSSGGAGGAGSSNSISGSSVTYAGGGGGGVYFGNTPGAGGAGGGGAGGANGSAGASGTSNTGGGGGGGGSNGSNLPDGGNGGSGIVIISYPAPQQFSGGVVTTSGGNVIHTFTTSGTLGPITTLNASYLIVAGGAGGGSGGGGGAGGLLSGSGLVIDPNSTYIVNVGAGGAGTSTVGAYGVNGTNSTFSIVATAAVGGGGGSSWNSTANNGASGGSGGGSGASDTGGNGSGGAGTSGQGSTGGNGFAGAGVNAGGGGGGAGAVGSNAASGVGGNGGVGVSSSISGSSTYYAGGGGGGCSISGTTGGTGGNGGGGNGGTKTAGANATANTGGGAGGGGYNGAFQTGGNGGSGIVIISYPGSTQQMAGGTVTIVGGNVIHTFTSTGYLAPLDYIGNSLRFRSSASAYMNRTPSTSSGQQTFTLSTWVKRGTISAQQVIFGINSASTNIFTLSFLSGDTLRVFGRNAGSDVLNLTTTALYRDPAAWYHIVVAIDTTQSTSSNRARMYVNGVEVTAFGTATYPSQNTSLAWNSSSYAHEIGRESTGNYLDGYLAEINAVSGSQLTPSSFGTFNSYGVWQPITYGGSYGTNGFYLPFTNNTSTTTLGYDFSPNGNNWTTNNISLTAGVTYDSMTDVPTLTSATAANYCVINPLDVSGSGVATLSNANLKATGATSAYRNAFGTLRVTSGLFYFEVTIDNFQTDSGIGIKSGSVEYLYLFNGNKYNGTSTAFGATYTTGDLIGVAFDISSGKIWWAKNGTWQASGDPAAGTNAAFTFTSGQETVSDAYLYGSTSHSYNFGQRPFTYTPPSGFVALNTYNL